MLIKSKLNNIKENLDLYKTSIIAVCKYQSVEKVKEVVSLGVLDLGINYVQQALLLKEELSLPQLTWHYIGNIQSKKLTKIVGNFDLIHSVSSIKIIKKINELSKQRHLTQDILLQINLSNEESKSGFTLAGYYEALKCIEEYESVRVQGLMTMPPIDKSSQYFKQLSDIKKEFNESKPSPKNCDIKFLSMGTSGDYVEAAKHGATHLRLGTVLMGKRIDDVNIG